MGLQEVAQIVAPGALALGGSLYGASRAGINADKAELWPVLGEATTVLARAKVELHHGFLRWTGDILDTSPEGEAGAAHASSDCVGAGAAPRKDRHAYP